VTPAHTSAAPSGASAAATSVMHQHPVGEKVTGPCQGPVVLDIGGDFGAAVVRTSHELDGSEIEIRRLPSRWDGTHVAVRSRPTPGRPVYAAVFGHLREGSYELRLRPAAGDAPVHRIEVAGGKVTESTWPERHP
jgi:hypothetical protein